MNTGLITIGYIEGLGWKKTVFNDVFGRVVAEYKYRTFRVLFRNGTLEKVSICSGTGNLKHIKTVDKFEQLHFIVLNEPVTILKDTLKPLTEVKR